MRYLAAAIGLAVVAIGAGTAPGAAIGEAAPEIQAEYWLNAPALALQALRGKFVVLQFWATSEPASRRSVPHLMELDKRYRSRGVVFIGLTDEPRATVEPFVRETGVTYPVGGGSSSLQEYGVRGIPTVFLVSPSGRIVWHGHPMGGLEEVLEAQLVKTPPAAEEEEDSIEAVLDRVGEEIRKRNYAAAAELLATVEEADADTNVKRRVQGYHATLVKAALASLAEAERHARQEAWYEASVALETAAEIAPGSDAAKRAEARLAELMADEKARPAIEQGREAAAAEALADLKAKQAEMTGSEVAGALEEIARKWPATKAGRQAAERAEKMRSEGL